MERTLPALRPIRWILVSILVAFAIWGLWWATHHYVGLDGDWMNYRATFDRILAGGPLYADYQAEPYSMLVATVDGGYVYPPSSVPMLALTTWLWPWRILNLGLLLAGTWVATRNWLAVALMLAFVGTWASWANGNVMPALVGLYGIAYGSQARWPAVIAGAVKVYPLVLLVLAWRRGEPLRWPIIATIAIGAISILGGYVPIALNGRPFCEDNQILSVQCMHPPLAYAVSAFLLLGAIAARTDRLAFALLCLAPFALAPDWTWGTWLLPMMAMLVLGTGLLKPRHGQVVLLQRRCSGRALIADDDVPAVGVVVKDVTVAPVLVGGVNVMRPVPGRPPVR